MTKHSKQKSAHKNLDRMKNALKSNSFFLFLRERGRKRGNGGEAESGASGESP